MKKNTLILLMVLLLTGVSSAQRIQQTLGRGVVAVTDNSASAVFVTWRKLVQDPDSCSFNLYQRALGSTAYAKINSQPITKTNFASTRSVIPYNTELAVSVVSKEGVEGEKSTPFLFKQQAYKDVFVNIDFETKILNPNDYKVKYVWPADLDGDGEMNEFIVDRLYAAVADDDGSDTTSTETTQATKHKLQAYNSQGVCLWTIDMGPNVNIDAGQNDMVLAYDINCDGKSEVLIKSSDGTRFWDKANETWGKYVFGKTDPDTDGDGLVDYCANTNTKRNPPFYVSVVNGLTGEEITSAELDYSQVHDGVDQYSRDNRSNYMNNLGYYQLGGHFAICYFDGVHPSLAMECLDRTVGVQQHHNYVFSFGYDWSGGIPSNFHHNYTWSRNDKTPWPAEFHQLRVCDVDGDGIDEMLQGGYGVNTTKGMVFSAGIGHGDRYRVSDIDPDRPGLETYAIQQSNLLGQLIYDAATGEHIKEWYLPSVSDVGRGECMDVDASHKGYEVYSTMQNLYDCKGNVITAGSTSYPYEGIWWNGDLLREALSSPGGSGYGSNVMVTSYGGARYIQFSKESNWAVHAGPAVRPAFIGDILGDWREEVILMKQNANTSTGIVGYSTDIASDYSIPCLQQDAHYRLDCTTRGYYQSPNTDFYLGAAMPAPPLYPSVVTDLRWKSGNVWNSTASAFTSFDMTESKIYNDDKSVIFDVSGDNTKEIAITGTLNPDCVYLMNPKGHDYTFGGTGTLAGNMNLMKSMQGTVTMNNQLSFTGKTLISEGRLDVNGTIDGPIALMAKGTFGGNATVNGVISFEGALNYEGCRLAPGSAEYPYGVITFNHQLTIPGNVYIEEGLSTTGNVKCGKIVVKGDLTFQNTNTFTILLADTKPLSGDYVIAECTGTLTVDTAKIAFRGLDGIAYDVKSEGKQLILSIHSTRNAAAGVVWSGAVNGLWDYRTANFIYQNAASTFVTDDEVVFNNQASQRDVTLDDKMVVKGVSFNFDKDKYSLSGDGAISGTGGLTKSGAGELVMGLENNDYTGPTVINGGTLTVSSFADAGKPSSIGASTADASNLVIHQATLKIDAYNTATDHAITLTDTATINVVNASGSFSAKGVIQGTGCLVKDGAGQLNFNYPGENPFAGIILRKGIISQGAWNSTFGKSGSPMELAGGTVSLIANQGMSTIPVFDNVATVDSATTNVINGSFRSFIKGSFMGKGTLTINSGGARSDIMSDFSQFGGTVYVGGDWRLTKAADLSKASVIINKAASVSHFVTGSGTTAPSFLTKFGSLATTDTAAVISNGIYETGYNNLDASFYGKIQSQMTKYGTGTWTLRGTGGTGVIYIKGGTVDLENGATNTVTSGSISIYAGGTLRGTGKCATVIVAKGGTLTPGKNDISCGTLHVNGNVSLQSGSTLLMKINTYLNDKLEVSGRLYHSNDTIRIVVVSGKTISIGDEFTLFSVGSAHSGTFVFDGGDIVWDTTTLLTDGKVKVKAISSGIGGTTVDGKVKVYSTDGILLREKVDSSHALEGLPKGLYVVNGHKIVK